VRGVTLKPPTFRVVGRTPPSGGFSFPTKKNKIGLDKIKKRPADFSPKVNPNRQKIAK